MIRLSALLVFLIFVTVGLHAQKSPSTADRLTAIEDALRSLTKQIADLDGKFQAPQEPRPVEAIPASDVSLAGVPRKGVPDAKIVLIEFSDFECPFCARHAHGPYAEIQQQYVAKGRVQYAFRHFPLEHIHPVARQAAEAAACAHEQGKFWELHDKLFVNQRALQLSNLQEYAKSSLMDGAKFDVCMTNHQMAKRVSDDLDEARRLGLRATPAFVLGEIQPNQTVRVTRRIVGAHPFEVFKSALDELLNVK